MRNGKPSQISRPNNDPKPYPICGGKNKSGFDCGRQAGWGTDHLGVGRCRTHGGLRESHNILLRKNFLTSSIVFPDIQEKLIELRQQDVFDLREHIFLMEAIMLTVIGQARTVDDLQFVAKLIKESTKIVQALDEIEHGRRLVIEVQGVREILAQVQAVVFRHVPDSYTRDLIATDIREIPVGGTGVTDFPRLEQDNSESSMAMEG